ncbi:hypothetical protein ACEV76_25070, partial [Vibrio parahaemolyticus]
ASGVGVVAVSAAAAASAALAACVTATASAVADKPVATRHVEMRTELNRFMAQPLEIIGMSLTGID